MPPQIEHSIEQKLEVKNITHPVYQITPVSKYLALLLFIALPFLGAYVGYRVALVQVTETVVTAKNVDSLVVPFETIDTHSSGSVPGLGVATEMLDSTSGSRQLNGTSSTLNIVEEYECMTAANNYPHLCFRLIERSTRKVVFENSNDLAKEQGMLIGTSSRSELQSVRYISENGRLFYFTVGVPETDACCKLAVLDVDTLTIKMANTFFTSVGLSTFSTNNRYVASVTEDNTTIHVADLEIGEIIKSASVTKGHLLQTYCGFIGNEASIVYNEATRSFVYGVYTDGPHSYPADGLDCYNDKIGEGSIAV